MERRRLVFDELIDQRLSQVGNKMIIVVDSNIVCIQGLSNDHRDFCSYATIDDR
jgi:hypothetical protein